MGLSRKTPVPSIYPSLAFRTLGPNYFSPMLFQPFSSRRSSVFVPDCPRGHSSYQECPHQPSDPRIYFCVRDDMQPFRLMVRPYSKLGKMFEMSLYNKSKIQLFPVFINSHRTIYEGIHQNGKKKNVLSAEIVDEFFSFF